ncbi:unnamed protein product [Phaedon cochleariae]|uniref:Uncharacterized protein n=1 Tax=Phaedon cochleariae TaxID=80249 RepID=A0A9N9X462_PHACE|nr:unnamed protein product [Phaedon cochleariae]
MGGIGYLIIQKEVILLTMVKTVIPLNYKGWFKNRLRTFGGTIEDQSWVDFYEDKYPTLYTLSTLQSMMSANFTLRRSYYSILRGIAVSGETFINEVAKEIINLMREAEMHHFVLIDKYLFNQYRELSSTKPLSGLVKVHKKVLRKLGSYPEPDVMYLQILHNKDDLAELNRANFKTASIIATACARYEHTSFNAYYSDESPRAKELSERVMEYLELKNDLINIAAGESDFINMGEKELSINDEESLEMDKIIMPPPTTTKVFRKQNQSGDNNRYDGGETIIVLPSSSRKRENENNSKGTILRKRIRISQDISICNLPTTVKPPLQSPVEKFSLVTQESLKSKMEILQRKNKILK